MGIQPGRDRQAHSSEERVALDRLGPPRRLAYGSTEIEKLDLYSTNRPNAPINVFIHGGAWHVGTAANAAYMSEMFIDAGAHFIALDFNNAIETNGDLVIMADQVRPSRCLGVPETTSFGGDSDRLYVSVYSGAHLTGVVLTTDWPKDFGLPADTVKGGLCCSGMYGLYPVDLSARSGYVKFTAEVIEALSSQRHLDKLAAPLIVAHGTLETPEFQRQNREFAKAVQVRKAGDAPHRRGLQPFRDV